MRRYCHILSLLALLPIVSGLPVGWADEPLDPLPDFDVVAGPLLGQYCGDCHAGGAAEAGLAYDELASGVDFQRDRTEWLHIVRRLRAGDMPPADMPQPTEDERKLLVDWLAARLEQVDCSGPPEPGHVTVRRLNREHYQNTIRDLLGVAIDTTQSFPPDPLGYGFDNNGDVLSLPPLLLEKYLNAAATVATQAVPSAEDYGEQGRRLRWQESEAAAAYDGEGRMLYTNGRLVCRFKARDTGHFALRATVSANQAGDEPTRMRVVIDDRQLPIVDVHASPYEPEAFCALFDASDSELRELGVEFTNDFYDPSHPNEELQDRNLIVHRIEVIGPLDLTDDVPRQAKRLLLESRPTPAQWQASEEWQSIARDRLRAFVPRAYRTDVDEDEVDRLIGLMTQARDAGTTYERALQLAVQAALASPKFLLVGHEATRSEPPVADEVAPIDEFVLASRLSYFLWGSMPDDELLALADDGVLSAELPAQVRRMLRDERAAYLADSFGGQWLETRQLAAVAPDRTTFPEFDEDLRAAMAREARELVASVITQDLPITTLLDADFTFLNQRLAEHYGIAGVEGDYFRRVPLTPEQRAQGRGGVLGLASVLTVTSNPDRTSPVMRGKFILASLLGDAPPPPPPNVPPLEDEGGKSATGTIRERLVAHQQHPGCASCHQQIDPLGFALEAFDGLGRVRTTDAGQPIDDTGTLPDGTSFRGATGLRDLLLARRDEFRRAFSEKLLTFALGRGLEYYDQCAIREIAEVVGQQDDKFSSLVLAIVESTPFLYERHVPLTPPGE